MPCEEDRWFPCRDSRSDQGVRRKAKSVSQDYSKGVELSYVGGCISLRGIFEDRLVGRPFSFFFLFFLSLSNSLLCLLVDLEEICHWKAVDRTSG